MKTTTTAEYIYSLIAQGEHQQQDFKFEISDARKIAKSLSAFANTNGGRLLVGVKDNGKIAGVRSEEEIYMLEAAAKLYCKPVIKCEMKTHGLEGRTVLEVVIPEGDHKPYYAKDHDNRFLAYLRIKDENILATPVHLKVWQAEHTSKGVFIRYSAQEQILLDFLNCHEKISLAQYCKLASLPRPEAIATLAKLIRFKLIDVIYSDKIFYYIPRPEENQG